MRGMKLDLLSWWRRFGENDFSLLFLFYCGLARAVPLYKQVGCYSWSERYHSGSFHKCNFWHVFCRDKSMFTATKVQNLCCDKCFSRENIFVATKLYIFVVTSIFLSRQNTWLWQKWHFWQLPLVIQRKVIMIIVRYLTWNYTLPEIEFDIVVW